MPQRAGECLQAPGSRQKAAGKAAAAAMLPLFNLWPPAAPLCPNKAKGVAMWRL